MGLTLLLLIAAAVALGVQLLVMELRHDRDPRARQQHDRRHGGN